MNDDTKLAIVLIIMVHALVIPIAIYHTQPEIEKNMIKHERELREKLDSMSCVDLWEYHTETFCSIYFGCDRNSEYIWAGKIYNARCMPDGVAPILDPEPVTPPTMDELYDSWKK